MKKKINFQFMIISAVGILLSLVLSTVVFYELLKKEVMDELSIYAHLIENMEGELSEDIYTDENLKAVRLTVVLKDGTVAYDSYADAEKMENHSNRPEIQQAWKNGAGKAVRDSNTSERNTFYYAIQLSDGKVLRVAKEVGSIWSVFISILPGMVVTLIILLAISMGISNLLTKSLLRPIKHLSENLDNPEDVPVYKELRPFMNTIQEQHKNILMSAKMRQEFTANVSHELKTPLTAISGYSELIENNMTTKEETLRFAGEIHKSANRLLTLINDTIHLSQLDVTEQEVLFEALDLYQIAKDCVGTLKVAAKKYDISISMHGTNAYLEGNREMLEELVMNLCDNAIRYNNKGGRVDVTVKPMGNQIYLCVEDNGIGIPKEHQERVFERFYRVDKSRSKSTGGTGLGLAIVKHILQKHDAKLEMTSEVGKGTKIEIEISKSR